MMNSGHKINETDDISMHLNIIPDRLYYVRVFTTDTIDGFNNFPGANLKAIIGAMGRAPILTIEGGSQDGTQQRGVMFMRDKIVQIKYDLIAEDGSVELADIHLKNKSAFDMPN
jgi:hypothetical protein